MDKGILGNTIREARIKCGYSQEELAELLGISPTHIKHIESEHRKPSIEILIKLMELLHFSFDSIVFRDTKRIVEKEISISLISCTDSELNIIQDLIHSLKKNK